VVEPVPPEQRLALQDNPDLPCSLDLLSQYAADLIALAHDEANLSSLKEIFSKRLYLTLPDPARGLPRNRLAGHFGLPLLVTHPVYYLTSEQATQ
jgi:hypothetical protein